MLIKKDLKSRATAIIVGLLLIVPVFHFIDYLRPIPPRPMFSNNYGFPEKGGIYRHWYPEFLFLDRNGCSLWCDTHDNTILLVDSKLRGRRNEMGFTTELEFANQPNKVTIISQPPTVKPVSFTRSPNRLVFVLPDASVVQMPIESDMAKSVLADGGDAFEDAIRVIRKYLSGRGLDRFNALIASEPKTAD